MNETTTTSTATTAPRKQRKEGDTTGDDTPARDGGAPPPARPNPNLKITAAIEPSRSAIESLPTEMQDHIARHVYAMHSLYLDGKKKEAGLSKIQSGAPNENEDAEDYDLTPPSCLRTMKNPLNGTKYTKSTEKFDVLREEMERVLDTYRREATKVMEKAAQLEIEKITELLVAAMHECATDIAEIAYIEETEGRNWRISMIEKDTVGNAVFRAYSRKL